MVPVLAFSLQDQAETYGAYVGIGAFLGLAVLSLLYFAQARELKRLRDWAGRSPERAQELEARVVAQAEEARRPPAPAPAPARSGAVSPAQPVKAAPAAVAQGNGQRPGAPVPVVAMGPRPAVAAAAAAAAPKTLPEEPAPAEAEEPATKVEAAPGPDDTKVEAAPPADAPAADAAPAPAASPPAAPEEDAEEESPATGNGAPAQPPTPPPAIPRATPRPQPRRAPAAAVRAPSRSATVPPRRGTLPPARRPAQQPVKSESPVGRIVLLSVIGVLVIAAAAFGATRILGGDDPAPPPNRTADPANDTSAPAGDAVTAEDARADAVVAVLNGTVITGLASTTRDKLVAEGYSEEQGMIRTGNNTDRQRQDSVVLYAEGERRQARDVATILDIEAIEQMDEETQALADNADSTGTGESVDVGVILGTDQSP